MEVLDGPYCSIFKGVVHYGYIGWSDYHSSDSSNSMNIWKEQNIQYNSFEINLDFLMDLILNSFHGNEHWTN